MNRILSNEFKPLCKITPETLLTILSVGIMWICYYLYNNHVFGDNLFFSLFWGFGILVGLNVVFPAWWIVRKKQEGFASMGITKRNLGPALLFSLALGIIRVPDLWNVCTGLSSASVLAVFIFNLLSIWEVCFIFSWLFTRFSKAFGKGLASVFTSISVGIYHCGTLKLEQILVLMGFILLCSLCFAVTENIFTLWPIYWVIGCSASVIRAYSAEGFPWSVTGLMCVILAVQVILLFVIRQKAVKQQKHS